GAIISAPSRSLRRGWSGNSLRWAASWPTVIMRSSHSPVATTSGASTHGPAPAQVAHTSAPNSSRYTLTVSNSSATEIQLWAGDRSEAPEMSSLIGLVVGDLGPAAGAYSRASE